MKVGTAARARPYRLDARAKSARARADRVLEVAVQLFTEKPYEEVSLDEVAARAQVSKRTILRHFGSKDALFVAAGDRAGEEMMHHRSEAPVGDVEGAVSNLLDHYERWGDNRLRFLAQEDRIPVVADNVRAGRQFHWGWVERTFPPLIRGLRGSKRKERVAALVVLTDVFTWKILRRDLVLTRAETQKLLSGLIRKLGEGGDYG